MKLTIGFLLLFIYQFSYSSNDNIHHLDSLEIKVSQYNRHSEYSKAIEILQNYISQSNVSNQDKYTAYLLYAYTYKRLFDYPTTIKYLNLARECGKNTKDSVKNSNNIDCEMAIVYFDITQYDSARQIMHQLRQNNFYGIDHVNLAYINMQEAYLLYLDNKYIESEKKYNYTLTLFQKYLPNDVANVYVKMMQLYHKIGDQNNCVDMYQKAIRAADTAHILKYKIYAKNEYLTILTENRDYKNALFLKNEIEVLEAQYNKNEHLLEIEKIESNYQLKLKELELNSYKRNLMIWIGFSILLLMSIVFIVFLYRKLSLRKKEIEIQNSLNERLTSIISHDIRESLLSTNLLKKLDTKDKYLDEIKLSIENQIININQILENILSVKRGSSNIQNTSEINECLNFCVNALSEQLKDKKIQIQNTIPNSTLIQYPLNKEKLKIILFNIFSNAIKYSHKDSKISVYYQDNHIYVRDFGIGINPELKSKIFSDTVASELGTNLESGNGMGLFFANSIIKDTKARISIESPIDGGTLVKIG